MITGSLPDILQYPGLNTLVLSNNCISGTLMASTNQGNSGLNTLVLNALSLGSYCPNKQVFHGSIPSSFFALPNLTDLYLVLTITLSMDINIITIIIFIGRKRFNRNFTRAGCIQSKQYKFSL